MIRTASPTGSTPGSIHQKRVPHPSGSAVLCRIHMAQYPPDSIMPVAPQLLRGVVAYPHSACDQYRRFRLLCS